MNTQLSLPFKRKNLLEDHFLRYQVLLGNKLRFTNPQTYEVILGLNPAGNSIFDIEKSIATLKCALTFIQKVQANDGIILFIGTRPDIKEIVKYVGIKTNSPYVNDRWLKGLLTNWENTSKSIHFYNIFLKKLGLRAKKKKRIVDTFLGLKNLKKLPDAIFIFDVNTDIDVLKEAKSLNIPIIAISDTNVSLNDIDYPILGNSGSIFSLAFFSNLIISTFTKKG
jgi:small subunit ribosomal protein S2